MFTLTSILIAAACFLVGAGIGHLYSRKTVNNSPSAQNLEQKLYESEQKLKKYQQEVTEHFVKVSHLTTNMAQSYRQIHEHLATSAIRLASPEIGRQLLKAGGDDLTLTDSEGKPLISSEELQPPLDYAPKATGAGVLSEEYGLQESDDLHKAHPEGAANNSDAPSLTEEDEEDPTHKVS